MMQPLLNIENCHRSPSGTFIRIFGKEKPPHELHKFSMDKFVMKEVAYHIYTRLSIGLHRRKNGPWPTLPFRIGLYEIHALKDADTEARDLKKFGFGTKSFNPYDPHCICQKHCAKEYYPSIHEACH